MKVFKFGGASVKDADGVRNVAQVLRHFPDDDLVIVVSAMGKTTNALEEVVWAKAKGEDVTERLDRLKAQHLSILREVIGRNEDAEEELEWHFCELDERLALIPSENSDRDYDQVVSQGEVWSTQIVSEYLNSEFLWNMWMDARSVITTDQTFRSARIDWDRSAEKSASVFAPFETVPVKRRVVVTQGFIGSSPEGLTTTLGREGSDFSAAIFAYLLDAESVTIWKDVPGMFNADPNRFPDTKLLEHISYKEAIELSYFGASVIHPRTLQPLQRKNIPLYVRSFSDLDAKGSTISEATDHDTLIPSFIIKPGQLLISITPRDLSFIVEENLAHIFELFARHRVRIDLMQNTAVAFSVCVENGPHVKPLILDLRRDYEVRYNKDVELVTVRHHDEATLAKLTAGREVLIEQRSRVTARFVLQ